MSPFFCAIFLLDLSSLAICTGADNFSQIFEWNELDYVWPSEANRTEVLQNRTFIPDNVEPRYMAVYGTRIFLSLFKYNNIPVTLVVLPTSSASSAAPKLTPFPSWDMNGNGDCNKIEVAKGLQVDSVGRLWVLDSGSDKCNDKIWTIDLINNDQTKLIHRFSFRYFMHDLVLDETPHGTFAYILHKRDVNIVVFSLERNQSWTVDTPGIVFYSIALSPKEEPRHLYLGDWRSKELYSIRSTATLRNGTRTANPELIGKWTALPCRILVDNNGNMLAAFFRANYVHYWNTSQPFEEQPFYEDTGLESSCPFTFALDQNGTLWMISLNYKGKPRYRLLKAAVGAKSLKASPELSVILICSIVFCVILPSLVILWLILRHRRNNNSLPSNTNETQEMSVFPNEPPEYHEVQYGDSGGAAEYENVGAEEGLYDEVKYDQVGATPPSPGLYEQPICLSPRSARRVKAMPERPRTFENFGEAPLAPVENDDVGPPEPEPLYDEVAPDYSTPRFDDTSSESAQYLKILP